VGWKREREGKEKATGKKVMNKRKGEGKGREREEFCAVVIFP